MLPGIPRGRFSSGVPGVDVASAFRPMPDEPARPRSTALGRHPTCCLAPAKKKRGPHWTPPLLCPPIPASTKPAHPGIRHSFDQVARSMPCIKFFDSTFPALSGQDLAGEPIRLRALGCAQIQFLEKRDRFVYVVWKMPRIRPRGPKTPHSGAGPSVEGFPEQDRGRRHASKKPRSEIEQRRADRRPSKQMVPIND